MELLAAAGCKIDATGRCGTTALEYSINSDSPEVCRWLIQQGCDIHSTNEFGSDSLKKAVEYGSVECAKLLIDAGGDPFQIGEHGFGLMHGIESVEMFELLAAKGLNTSQAGKELRMELLGLASGALPVSEQDYLKNRERKYGVSNPEQMNNAFWDGQVQTRLNAYHANQKFGRSAFDFESPTWCCDRYGQSFTRLPDGRFVEIGGEHEDSYDPDFCIYNDVIVHDGAGGFKIYGYPESVFPPTDFHSATLVGDTIVIIGRLGYVDDRQLGSTPVYVLNCTDWSIEKLETKGRSPGWLFKQTAHLLDERRIQIRGGKKETKEAAHDNKEVWTLDLQDRSWTLE